MLLPIMLLAAVDLVFACPGGFAPVNMSILRLGGTDPPISWHDVDWQCTVQFTGYEILKRNFTNLTSEERELCGNDPVPLGLQKTRDGPILWRGAYGLPNEEKVSAEYLAYKLSKNETYDATDWRGSLNLTSNEWQLVEHETKFRCALCQRARRAALSEFWAQQYRRQKPYTNAYTLLVDAMNLTEQELEFELKQAKKNIIVDTISTVYLRGKRKFSVRLKSSKSIKAGVVQSIIPELKILSWRDMDYCTAFTSDMLNSTMKKIGTVASARLPGRSGLISRDCSANVSENGDFDAVWGPTMYWVDINQECSIERFENVSRTIDEYRIRLETVANATYNLTALADVTSTILSLVHKLDQESVKIRHSILTYLEHILETLYEKPKTNSTKKCVKKSCVFLNSDDRMTVDSQIESVKHLERKNVSKVFLFSYGELPKYVYSKSPESNNQTNHLISAEFPNQGHPHNDTVALQALQDDGDSPFMQPRGGKWVYYWMAVLMVVTTPKSTTSFTVRISRANPKDKARSYEDHWAVWKLDGQTLGSSTCLMINQNTQFDLYRCDQPRSGTQNLSTGKYIAYTHYRSLVDDGKIILTDVNAAADLVHRYTNQALDRSMLEVVAEIADYVVGMDFGETGHNVSRRIQSDLENVFSGANLKADGDYFLSCKRRAKVLVSRPKGKFWSVLGMSVRNNETGSSEIQSIQTVQEIGGKLNISKHSKFDIVLESKSALLVDNFSILLFSEFKNFYPHGSMDSRSYKALLVVHVTAVTPKHSGAEGPCFDIYVNFDDEITEDMDTPKERSEERTKLSAENLYESVYDQDEESDDQPEDTEDDAVDGKIVRVYRFAANNADDERDDDDDDGHEFSGSGDYPEVESEEDEDDEEDTNTDETNTAETNSGGDKENGKHEQGPLMKANPKIRIAIWIDAENNWSKSCTKRKSTYNQKTRFRCTLTTLQGNVFSDKFLIYKIYHFSDFLDVTLLTMLVVIGILSAFSIFSITASSIALASWRQDVGHRILLQTSIALSLNLALGFYNSIVIVDTETTECIVVGVFRHYSYLATFAWMLIMSSLQLWRLLSFFGARNTPRLLLKVSVIAWGVPLIVVGSLLAYDKTIYRSVDEDRGFCYPEGTAFNWVVQGPAALILVLNFIIFIVILARVFAFYGWGETENLRRHMDMNSHQVARLKAVFFTFCLFGLTWVFHLLAEQGVFKEKFVYEYMFLVTASLHLFLLSCIFVWLNGTTRRDWVTLWQQVWNARNGSQKEWSVSYLREQITLNFYSKESSEN